MGFAYFNHGAKQRERRRRWLRERKKGPTMTLTWTERDCLVRAIAQDGRLVPTGLDSAMAEIVRVQLQRKGFVTNGPGDCPCITPAGEEAVKQTKGRQLPDH